MSVKTEAEVLQAASIAATDVRFAAEGRGCYVTLPEGYEVHSLEKLQNRPNRIRARCLFSDTASLALYLNRFATDATLMFSDVERQRIEAAIDHDMPGEPSHREHSASFAARHSSEYERWRSISGKAMSQLEAGTFLEDRARAVVVPSAADIMDMVMKFDALQTVSFRQSTRLHDGQRQFSYVEENEARGAVQLPDSLTILCPVFEGQEPQRIQVRIRYRIRDGKLSFTFEIAQMPEVERAAFEQCEDGLRTELVRDIPMMRV